MIRFPLLSLAVPVLATALVGCSSSPSQPQLAGAAGGINAPAAEGDAASLALMDETPINADRATLRVEGLSCPACATNVDHQLKDVAGVRLVEVNLGDGTVALSLGGASRPSRADLARAIHDSGFTLRAIDVP